MQKRNNALTMAKYQKAQGVKLGVNAVYHIISAAIWNAADDAGLTDKQRSTIASAVVAECERLMHMIGDANTAEDMEEMTERIVGNAKQCAATMKQDGEINEQ